MEIPFVKMHGAGNDYLFLDAEKPLPADLSRLSRVMSDRHRGIGSDGIVLVGLSPNADFSMRIFNADGSEGAMCGNALRCLGRYVSEQALTSKLSLSVETKAGLRHIRMEKKEGILSVKADMGRAAFSEKGKSVLLPLGSPHGTVRLWQVDVGNPHAVLFTGNPDWENVASLGSRIEHHPRFSGGVNVEFVSVRSENHLRVRVWERGSGETQACGTGACASAFAAFSLGYAEKDFPCEVEMPGGVLAVRMLPDGRLFLSGETASVFRGVFSYEEEEGGK